MCAEVAEISGKIESSIHEVVKKEKDIHASFVVASQSAKVVATVSDNYLVKMEKALNVCNMVF